MTSRSEQKPAKRGLFSAMNLPTVRCPWAKDGAIRQRATVRRVLLTAFVNAL